MSDYDTYNVPGGFQSSLLRSPTFNISSSPYKKDLQQATPENNKLLSENPNSPSANSFKFTPTRGRRLYPCLSPPYKLNQTNNAALPNTMSDDSYICKENQSFVSAMDHLQEKLFSSKLSNKVLNEFTDRYEKVRSDNISNMQKFNSRTSNDELNRRASNRYSNAHKSRFNRMESITFHYAAKRAEQKEQNQNQDQNQNKNQNQNQNQNQYQHQHQHQHQHQNQNQNQNQNLQQYQSQHQKECSKIHRNLVQTTKLSPPGFFPYPNLSSGDKRLVDDQMQSASKRLKIKNGDFKEIIESPTKSLEEKEKIKHQHLKRLEKNSIQKKKENQRETKLEYKDEDSKNDKTEKISSKHRIPSYLLPTRAFLQKTGNETHQNSHNSLNSSNSKFLPPKISPSKACSDLHSILQKPQPKNTTFTKIPKSTTIGVSMGSNNNKNSKMSGSSSTRSFSRSLHGSSSIPRLVKLSGVENIRARNESTSNLDKDKGLRPWRY